MPLLPRSTSRRQKTHNAHVYTRKKSNKIIKKHEVYIPNRPNGAALQVAKKKKQSQESLDPNKEIHQLVTRNVFVESPPTLRQIRKYQQKAHKK